MSEEKLFRARPAVIVQLHGDPGSEEGAETVKGLVAAASLSPNLEIAPSFPGPVEELREWHRAASESLGVGLERLNSFFRVWATDSDEQPMQEAVERLKSTPAKAAALAGTALFSLHEEPEGQEVEEVTPDLSDYQRYLGGRVSGGVGARAAWLLQGGNGAGARLCDCEGGFYPPHEDIGNPIVVSSRGGDLTFHAEHGTRALGVIGGLPNGRGVLGVAHGAQVLFASEAPTSGSDRLFRTEAIRDAINPLRAGGVLLLEMQAFGRSASPLKVALPAEFDIDVHAACRVAAGLGVTVVAAAGNGEVDLANCTDSLGRKVWAGSPKGPNDPLDSLAILVGAGHPEGVGHTPRSWLQGTNYGLRITCQGWGSHVATAAQSLKPHEVLFNGGTITRNYAIGFGQTSAATAMIGGVVACLQGRALHERRKTLSPLSIRRLLSEAQNGYPQPSSDVATHPIGPLPFIPDLIKAAGLG